MYSPTLKIFAGRAGLCLAVLVLLLWSIGPVYWSLVTSLTPPNDLVSAELHLWPQTLTFEHYNKLFGATSQSQGNEVQSVWPQFSRAFFNSIVTSVGATLLTVVIAAFGAYAFVRFSFPGRDILFFIVVATMAIPAYTVMIPLYRLMISVSLIDTMTGVILIYVSAFLPLALWLMRSIYQAIPISLEEAAYLDGAGKTHTLIKIILPIAAPGLIAAAILTFLNAWGQFMVPLVFSPTLATKPLTVLIPEFVTRNYIDYGLMNAAGIIAVVPPILLVIFLNRFLVSGLMAGAGK
ncbi:carbohydrate ABC transporter permease [Granulosicoccus antarcticus]|uniref:Trehalose transport system permease protein SugB n=1 Tax=Granulosicoccus antarcticus IMCC3135 TaxID=1192854 RepID=A0A2Z2NR58_9GAMM|nr:carbohydrate ABC transporter permease [Granulosicoccus antarcticus]ASJ73719.1 Trehalose transport system permease protein SugB [Granulosicoccus antarcticus IMCC3135]